MKSAVVAKKIAPVSGSFCSILKLLRMIAFTELL